ncbi:phosphorylase superfamily [Fusarium subglutinans]|uniref:Phosphorylase superfamily n=1 Tax=Gibberella subglutinans TaxID=42677 RepID=A0A8H5Q157_GIBSU|nr:phosphorylase superfamily [Fusarium subglutinans]KAF5606329.1 phosphorylase superfamily [Fusarium subglutinans]
MLDRNLSNPPPRSRNDVTIAVLCALSKEFNAVVAVFDESWESAHYGKAHDTSEEAGDEILLGDVIITNKLVQTDFGRQLPDAVYIKDTLDDSLGRHSSEVRSFLKTLGTFQIARDLRNDTARNLTDLLSVDGFEKFRHPGFARDKLFSSEYRHKHHQADKCSVCDGSGSVSGKVCDVALNSTCESLGCDESALVVRSRLTSLAQSETTKPEHYKPVIHIGTMGSSDQVIKSAFHRDMWTSSHQIIGFEMEGAGAWDSFPTILIKGVCDYADSRKNKNWQGYASESAAAFLKAVLRRWTPVDEPTAPIVDMKQHDQWIQSFFLQPYKSQKDRNERAAVGTCSWVMANPLFLRWQSNEFSDVFWVTAEPGSGKKLKEHQVNSYSQSPVAPFSNFWYSPDHTSSSFVSFVSFVRISLDSVDHMGAIREDISHYIEMTRVRQKFCLSDEVCQCLVFREIERSRGKTVKKILKMIDNLPNTVEGIYETILEDVEDRDETENLFMIIQAAKRPLTLSEIDVAMELAGESTRYEDLDLEGDEGPMEYIRQASCLLVLVDETVSDFLLTAPGPAQVKLGFEAGSRPWKSTISRKDSHTTLAKLCLAFLQLEDFTKAGIRLQLSYKYKDTGHPKTTYFPWTIESYHLGSMKSLVKRLVNGEMLPDSTVSVDLTESVSVHPNQPSGEHLKEIKARFSFLEYAATYWHIHVAEADMEPDGFILSLFDINSPQYATWLPIYWQTAPRHERVHLSASILALCFGHRRALSRLIANGLAVDERDPFRQTALHWAASRTSREDLEFLISQEAIIDAADSFGRTSLMEAVIAQKQAHVAILLDHQGAEPQPWTVFKAEEWQNEEIKRLLRRRMRELGAAARSEAERNASPTARMVNSIKLNDARKLLVVLGRHAEVLAATDSRSNNTLHIATTKCSVEVACLLVERGIDPNAVNTAGVNAQFFAHIADNQPMISYLLEVGVQGFCKATSVKEGVISELRSHAQLLEIPPLVAAIRLGAANIVLQLLEEGENVNQTWGPLRKTPIFAAVERDQQPIINVLLGFGADVDSRNLLQQNLLCCCILTTGNVLGVSQIITAVTSLIEAERRGMDVFKFSDRLLHHRPQPGVLEELVFWDDPALKPDVQMTDPVINRSSPGNVPQIPYRPSQGVSLEEHADPEQDEPVRKDPGMLYLRYLEGQDSDDEDMYLTDEKMQEKILDEAAARRKQQPWNRYTYLFVHERLMGEDTHDPDTRSIALPARLRPEDNPYSGRLAAKASSSGSGRPSSAA